MKAVQVITGTGIPLRRSDVDTDQIIPAEWLKRVERTGFEKGLFSTWRDDPSFVLNDERYTGANILVAGPSFGVGSSREHAVWAIQQAGFEAVIAPSFSDIFRNNCTKNGLVPAVLDLADVEAIWNAISLTRPLRSSSIWSGLWLRCQRLEFRHRFPWTSRRNTGFWRASTTSASPSATRKQSTPTSRNALRGCVPNSSAHHQR